MTDKNILILEDDPDTLFNLMAFFSDEGFGCQGAESAEEALAKVSDNKYDLAIVDINLPQMSGEDFIPAAALKNSKMKFIIHTGTNGFELSDALKSLNLTGDLVFKKPITEIDILVNKINELIN